MNSKREFRIVNDALILTYLFLGSLSLRLCHPNPMNGADGDVLIAPQCISGECVGKTEASTIISAFDHSDENPAPVVRIYSPSEGENISGIVFVTWEVLYFDISDGYVEIELDGEVVETPLPLDPVSGNFLEPELVFDRSCQLPIAPNVHTTNHAAPSHRGDQLHFILARRSRPLHSVWRTCTHACSPH